MKISSLLATSSLLAALLTASHFVLGREKTALELGVALPAFTQSSPQAWLNSPPLAVGDLKGTVLLIDFWAFECWNCYRSFPWLKQLEKQFEGRGFQIIGVHSPEFERERDPEAVKRKAIEFGLSHPIMLDNDFAFWRAMGNRYWPAYYLVDKQGRVRHVFVGETHQGDSQSRRIGTAISRLLAE